MLPAVRMSTFEGGHRAVATSTGSPRRPGSATRLLSAQPSGRAAAAPSTRRSWRGCTTQATALRELIEGADHRDGGRLEQALRRVVLDARTLAEHDIRLTAGPIDDSPPATVVDAMASATREALTNVRKHANARNVWVYVEVTEEQALITVKDDGIGVDLQRLRPGLGVRRSIVGRMEGIDGTASFTSAPGRGMLVTIRWVPDACGAGATACVA